MWSPSKQYCRQYSRVVTVKKINSCVFPLIVRVMSKTKPILHTAGVRLCACFLRYSLFSRVHLEVCSPQGHKYRLRFETDLILSPSAKETTLGFRSSHAWVLLWFGTCFGFTTIQRHFFGFCLFFFPKPFHWALTGGDIPPEAITVLSISQLLWSPV